MTLVSGTRLLFSSRVWNGLLIKIHFVIKNIDILYCIQICNVFQLRMERHESISEVIAKDIPVLEDLLKTLDNEKQSICESVDSLLNRIQDGELTTSNGISLLDVKYHTLLSYITDIILIAKMKVEGISIANCKAKHRLVESRTVLEKMQPLEEKMKYQIDKLLRQSNINVANDPLSLKPDIDNLENKLEESEEDKNENTESQKYVPPHIAALSYDGDGDKKEKQMMRSRVRALKKSSIISELAQETSDAPLEISGHSGGKQRVQRDRMERNRYEETNLTRITLTKKQINAEKRMMRQSELDTIAKFGDISVLDDNTSLHSSGGKRKSGGKGKPRKKWKKLKK